MWKEKISPLHRPVNLEALGLQRRTGCAVQLSQAQVTDLWASVGGTEALWARR
jgi:hypothetical protein